jgi:hypothetical protein
MRGRCQVPRLKPGSTPRVAGLRGWAHAATWQSRTEAGGSGAVAAKSKARVYANRRRIRGRRGKRLHRKRAELAERSHAHLYETGGTRHLYLRGRTNVEKRLVVHGAGFNLCLVLRKRFGLGKPRSLQGLLSRLSERIHAVYTRCSHNLRLIRALDAAKSVFQEPVVRSGRWIGPVLFRRISARAVRAGQQGEHQAG